MTTSTARYNPAAGSTPTINVDGAASAATSPTSGRASSPAGSASGSPEEAIPTVRVGELYWKPEDAYGWRLGQVVAANPEAHTARFYLVDETTGEFLSASPTADECVDEDVDLRTTPLLAANPLFSTAADMTSLRHLHEAALAKNLADRASFQNQRPYTFMANVLLAVNPLRTLEMPAKQLFVGHALDRCPPHPYHIAETAYRQLCAVRAVMQNQSIIISGESGSGKTETSKILLDFLTTRASRMTAQTLSSCASSSEEEAWEPEFTSQPARGATVMAMATATAGALPPQPMLLQTATVLPPPPPSATRALSFPQAQTLAQNKSSSHSHPRKLSPVALGARLMETIPILESFGNAKTHRNHNSSRFGKYMRLQFSATTRELSGASIETYLLEKSRLVQQPKGERNFHIFYELLAATERATFVAHTLHLEPKNPHAYAFLNQSGAVTVDGVDDAANFQRLCQALEFVGIQEEARQEIFRVVAGLLHLGNVVVAEEDTSEGKTACVKETDAASLLALQHAAELLGVAMNELRDCILLKRIMTSRGTRRGSIYYSKRDARTAVYSRDTIAKTIYEHVFTWLMEQCACALEYDAARSDVVPYIGVLDIFGFEDFEPANRNSFEQLLINYANEALQSLFNTCIFEAEQELYRSEHIYTPLNHSLTFPFAAVTALDEAQPLPRQLVSSNDEDDVVKYTDNRECLNLLASRHGGIFVTIDNVSRLPSPSDRKLNERLHTLFKRHPCFPRPHPKDISDRFIVRHYAGTVTYHIASFVDKNNNIVSDQFEELIKGSTSRILQEITGRNRSPSQTKFSNQAVNTNAMGSFGASKRSKGGSASYLFSTQMNGLVNELEGTACSFVRCIKPNREMKPGVFDQEFVVEQLRCSGTVQACEVLRVGLPTRILYAEVVDVYKNFLPDDMFERFDFNDKLFTQAILWAYEFPTSAYRLGDTRLFFRTGKIDLLDRLLSPTLAESSSASGAANTAPSTTDVIDPAQLTRDMFHYLHKKRWIGIATRVIAYCRFQQIYIACKYRRKAIIIQCMVRQRLARRRVQRIRVLQRIHGLWARLSDRSRIMNAYQDRPEDKMVLLNKLLPRNYLPPGQRWLLKWLGPLQRVLYLQKLWKRLTAQYLAGRGFIWLLNKVRRRRSALRMQALARCVAAKKRFRRLKQARIARERWERAYLKVRVFCLFRRVLQRVHVARLEQDNEQLAITARVAAERLQAAEAEVERLRATYQTLHVEMDQKTIQIAEQTKRIDVLETELESAQDELVGLRQRAAGSVMERMIRFFTCTTAGSTCSSSPSSSPRSTHGNAVFSSETNDRSRRCPDSEKHAFLSRSAPSSQRNLSRRRLAPPVDTETKDIFRQKMAHNSPMETQPVDLTCSLSQLCM